MEPGEFRNAVVIPDVNDLKAKYDDIRAAYHAVASVDALAAHIFAWCKRNNMAEIVKFRDDSGYRQHLAQKDADFGLLRDIAKAHKHVILDRVILRSRELKTFRSRVSVGAKLRGARVGGAALRRWWCRRTQGDTAWSNTS